MKIFKTALLAILIATQVNCSNKIEPVLTNSKPLTVTNFKVYEKDAKQVVEWSAGPGSNINFWQVQASANGAAFTTIAIVLGDDPKQPGTYRYSKKIEQGSSLKKYYRLCHIGEDGTKELSEIIRPAK